MRPVVPVCVFSLLLILLACAAEPPEDVTPSGSTPPPEQHAQTPPGAPVSDSELLSVEEVVAKALPSVLQIVAGDVAGTGFLTSANGHVITNWHVVQGVGRVQLSTATREEYMGQVVERHEYLDLAYIQIDSDDIFVPIEQANSDGVRVGEQVVAIGFPLESLLPGLSPTISVGVISARRPNFIQTDASINPGNSGGPLVNMAGQVIGVVTSRLERTDSGRNVEGIAFAIPMNAANGQAEENVALPSPTPAFVPDPSWRVIAKTDPVTGDSTVQASNYAIEHSLGTAREAPELIISCTSNKRPEVKVEWGIRMGLYGDFWSGMIRWDDEPAVEADWRSGGMYTIPTGDAFETIVGPALESESMYLRLGGGWMGPNSPKHYAKFDLAQLRAELGDHADACRFGQ